MHFATREQYVFRVDIRQARHKIVQSYLTKVLEIFVLALAFLKKIYTETYRSTSTDIFTFSVCFYAVLKMDKK